MIWILNIKGKFLHNPNRKEIFPIVLSGDVVVGRGRSPWVCRHHSSLPSPGFTLFLPYSLQLSSRNACCFQVRPTVPGDKLELIWADWHRFCTAHLCCETVITCLLFQSYLRQVQLLMASLGWCGCVSALAGLSLPVVAGLWLIRPHKASRLLGSHWHMV